MRFLFLLVLLISTVPGDALSAARRNTDAARASIEMRLVNTGSFFRVEVLIKNLGNRPIVFLQRYKEGKIAEEKVSELVSDFSLHDYAGVEIASKMIEIENWVAAKEGELKDAMITLQPGEIRLLDSLTVSGNEAFLKYTLNQNKTWRIEPWQLPLQVSYRYHLPTDLCKLVKDYIARFNHTAVALCRSSQAKLIMHELPK